MIYNLRWRFHVWAYREHHVHHTKTRFLGGEHLGERNGFFPRRLCEDARLHRSRPQMDQRYFSLAGALSPVHVRSTPKVPQVVSNLLARPFFTNFSAFRDDPFFWHARTSGGVRDCSRVLPSPLTRDSPAPHLSIPR